MDGENKMKSKNVQEIYHKKYRNILKKAQKKEAI